MIHFLLLHHLVPTVFAFPLRKRFDPASPALLVPVIIVGVGLLGMVALLVWKKAWRRKVLSLMLCRRGIQSQVDNDTREVTAEQLAGAGNTSTSRLTSSEAPAPNTRPTRRTRRNRRTPSQVSVTSLPVYNSQAGVNELVVNVGVRESQDEDADDNEDDVNGAVNTPSASPGPVLPLQDGTNAPQGSTQIFETPSPPPPQLMSSADESLSMEEAASPTIHSLSDSPYPAGEVPPYPGHAVGDEVSSTADQEPQPTPPPPQVTPLTSRRTTFRSFLPPFTRMRLPTSNPDTHHHRPSASPTPEGESLVHLHSPRSRTPRLSQSGSVMSLHSLGGAPLRTLSRQRSTQTLNSNHLSSASLISVNSISAPLRETVMKTEFVYPQSGPTREQMKLISSRESLGRFGRPYGSEAIAFAASRSRLGLLDPPPDFQDRPTEDTFDGLPSDGLPLGDNTTHPHPPLPTTITSRVENLSDLSPTAGSTVPPIPNERVPQPPPVSFRTQTHERSESPAGTMTEESSAAAQEEQPLDDNTSGPRQQVQTHGLEPTDTTIRPS